MSACVQPVRRDAVAERLGGVVATLSSAVDAVEAAVDDDAGSSESGGGSAARPALVRAVAASDSVASLLDDACRAGGVLRTLPHACAMLASALRPLNVLLRRRVCSAADDAGDGGATRTATSPISVVYTSKSPAVGATAGASAGAGAADSCSGADATTPLGDGAVGTRDNDTARGDVSAAGGGDVDAEAVPAGVGGAGGDAAHRDVESAADMRAKAAQLRKEFVRNMGRIRASLKSMLWLEHGASAGGKVD